MSNQRKVKNIEKEIKESDNGFKYVEERSNHTVYEDDEVTGAGATGTTEKIVTPYGEELTSLEEVFTWIDENVKNSFTQQESVSISAEDFGKSFEKSSINR